MLYALPWLILFLPAVAAAAIFLFTRNQRETSAALSIGAVTLSFLLAVVFVAGAGWQPERREVLVTWLEVGDLQVDFGLRLDRLSLLMAWVVSGVAAVIHIYSFGYMRGDRGLARYFASMSLFTFSMLGIVFANNLLLLFVFWELVGVSSYLLIGFWYERPAAADASKKAFLTNRLGDFGFLLGILMVWAAAGSLNFSVLQDELQKNPALLGTATTAAGLLLFCGAVGKSAQFPLHVWLPDAMEGPTPVSALIHAATMVAAGVYLLCRLFFILALPMSSALIVIAWIGGITALLAGLIATQQNDIKRILAYSTLSQLGYMVMAVGLAAPAIAMYHLTTHAFFKALLFLGAGSVIHALHHEQDIWRMGGLNRTMPVTFVTFLLGTLALCGVPPLSGFYSKDAILAAAAQRNLPLFLLAVGVAALTAFYMFRLLWIAFLGKARGEPGPVHESPPIMTGPLMVLAAATLLAGVWGIETHFERFFAGPEESVHPAGVMAALFHPFSHAPLAALAGLFALMVGAVAATALYANAARDPVPLRAAAFARILRHRFYFDEAYDWLIRHSHEAIARTSDWVDRWLIAGLAVRGAQGTTEFIGRALRLAQTGNLQTYAFLFVAGTAAILFYVYFK